MIAGAHVLVAITCPIWRVAVPELPSVSVGVGMKRPRLRGGDWERR